MAARKLQKDLDSANLENDFLKMKNNELARALSDKSEKCNTLVHYNEELQSKVFSLEVILSMYTEGFKRIMRSASATSVQLVNMCDEVTYLLAQRGNKKVIHSPPSNQANSKTQAVKPMVSGHTICRPTIKLPRVSTERLAQMNVIAGNGVAESLQNEIQQNFLYTATDDEANMMELAEETTENGTSVNDEGSDNARLETLHEVDEAESYDEQTIQEATNRSPLISGIFKDVRVYITPMSGAISNTSNHLKRKSISSQTHLQTINVNGRQGDVSTDSDMSGTVTFKRRVNTAEPVQYLAASRDYNAIEDTMHDISTIPQINESTYQEELLDESKMPEVTENNKSNYNPLEGPSTLLDVSDNKQLTMSMFNLAPNISDNKTSTPYTEITVRRKASTTASGESNLCIPTQRKHITQRRNNMIADTGESGDVDVATFANCTVMLKRLSQSEFMQANAGTTEELPQSEKNSLVNDTHSPPMDKRSSGSGRPRRTTRPIKSLKEPSLNKKLRR